MASDKRSYSDPSYGSKKTVSLPITDVCEGSNSSAATLSSSYKFMEPVTILDFNLNVEVAGTGTATSAILGTKLDGTGAFAAIGTASLVGTLVVGTAAIAGSVTETDMDTGDVIELYHYGTDNALVTTLIPNVQYKERFVVTDN